MYNTALKNRFLERYPEGKSMRKGYVTLFEAISQYEAEWDADICTRSHEELKPVVAQIIGIRMSSTSHRVYLLRDYVRWCIENGVPNACDGALQPFEIGLEKLSQTTLSNPKHMQIYLDAVFPPESDLTLDCVYRCYLWLSYMGMDEEDIVEVRVGDIDLSEMVIKFKDQSYPLYRESLSAFKACMSQNSFRRNTPDGHDFWMTRGEGDILLRGVKNSSASATSIRSSISQRVKRAISEGKTTLSLSYYRAWLSGVFYRVYENECCGLPVDFKPVVRRHIEKRHMNGKAYKLDIGRNTEEFKARQIESDYIMDYKRWKKVYHGVT